MCMEVSSIASRPGELAPRMQHGEPEHEPAPRKLACSAAKAAAEVCAAACAAGRCQPQTAANSTSVASSAGMAGSAMPREGQRQQRGGHGDDRHVPDHVVGERPERRGRGPEPGEQQDRPARSEEGRPHQ